MLQSLIDFPPMPQFPIIEPFDLGITTRVMAKKQMLRLANKKTQRSFEERRHSRFLAGAAIPNSTARASLKSNDSNTIEINNFSKYSGINCRSPNDSVSVGQTSNERVLERIRRVFGSSDQTRRSQEMKSIEKSNAVDEKQRISRRTLNLESGRARRRSTLESIKQAIDNSSQNQKLVDVDSFEKIKNPRVFKLDWSADLFLSRSPLRTHSEKRSSSRSSKRSLLKFDLDRKTIRKDLQTQTSFNIDMSSRNADAAYRRHTV